MRLFGSHLRRPRQVFHVALLQQLQVRSTISAATSMLRRRSSSLRLGLGAEAAMRILVRLIRLGRCRAYNWANSCCWAAI
jgi:hypothetical protein